MSLGAIDFGLIVDGAVIIVENCLRRLAERAAPSSAGRSRRAERLDVVFDGEPSEVRERDGLRRGDHRHSSTCPILALTGVEGKMFQPDGADGDLRARRGLRAVADVRAGDGGARACAGRVREQENVLVRRARRGSTSRRCGAALRVAA